MPTIQLGLNPSLAALTESSHQRKLSSPSQSSPSTTGQPPSLLRICWRSVRLLSSMVSVSMQVW